MPRSRIFTSEYKDNLKVNNLSSNTCKVNRLEVYRPFEKNNKITGYEASGKFQTVIRSVESKQTFAVKPRGYKCGLIGSCALVGVSIIAGFVPPLADRIA